MRYIAGILAVCSFAMCTKSAIEKPTSYLAGIKSRMNAKMSTGVNDDDNTYTVQPSQWFVDGTNIAPGTIIYIPAGTRGALMLKNLKGTAVQPIIIINKGGRATLSTDITASYCFKTINCQYFKILGSGVPGITCGLVVNGGNIGMTMDDFSSDFEIVNVEVRNSGFAGIMAKTDPTCDVATQRGNFIMKNVSIHHNYVHKTGGEGLYIGNSFYADGRDVACGKVYPHDVINLSVYKNVTDSTGCEGIQIGSATAGCRVYQNTVRSPGISPFASGQNNGIQIGEGTGGACFNNLVKNAPGNGIIVLGLGDNMVYNNIIINAGQHGIFADSRYTPGPYFIFVNNTIIAPALNGIKLNSETVPVNIVTNNVIVNPATGVGIRTMNGDVKLEALNNYTAMDINDCKFVNPNNDDYHLLSTSPLINAGANVQAYGIRYDYYNKFHLAGTAYGIGASEY